MVGSRPEVHEPPLKHSSRTPRNSQEFVQVCWLAHIECVPVIAYEDAVRLAIGDRVALSPMLIRSVTLNMKESNSASRSRDTSTVVARAWTKSELISRFRSKPARNL